MDNNTMPLELEKHLSFPLYAASRELIKNYRPYLETLDLTYTQYIAMLVFWEVKKISVKELGKRLFLDSGTLTPVLKSLEVKGLVKRYRSAEDERVLIVEISEAGESLRDNALQVPLEFFEKNATMTQEELDQLSCALFKLLKNITE